MKKSYDWQERAKMDERKLTDGEKDKLKSLEKDVSKKDFIDRYGKEEGESYLLCNSYQNGKTTRRRSVEERKRQPNKTRIYQTLELQLVSLLYLQKTDRMHKINVMR